MSTSNINLPKIESNDDGVVPSSKNLEHDELHVGERYVKKHKASMPRGADKPVLDSGTDRSADVGGLPHSQFSDYHLFRFKQANGENYPLTDIKSKDYKDSLYQELTPNTLIKNPMGASVFKAEDFIYLERLNKLPLNRMITLRRFAYPVVDDIFSSKTQDDEPDISRMITYSDQEFNKMGELMSFSFGVRWKELNSEMEAMQMHGNSRSGVSGYMKNVMKFVDPTFGRDQVRGDTALSLDPTHDKNRVYGMVDSISSTHIREIGLNFDQEFKLNFKYKMRSYNGVNGKAAFMDLLSNILLCCTNDAKFWGGARYWVGRRPTKYMKNLKFLSPTSFDDFLNKAHVEFKGFLGKGSGGGDSKKEALSMLKNVAGNVFNMGFGKLLDKIGRPGIPYMNSLLTGNPVGAWHVTIGNPLNPRMVLGNLLLTNTTITFGETMGRDDFPEDITVECTLKHAMPRGRAEIEQMFNYGRGRMYWKPQDVIQSLDNDSVTKSVQSINSMDLKTVTDFVNSSRTKFGHFDKAAVLRNAEKVWSFEKINKD